MLRGRRWYLQFVLTDLSPPSISTVTQLGDSLRWTTHLDECLQHLDTHRIHPLDELLVHQVKVHLIVEQAKLASWFDSTLEVPQTLRPPPTIYPQALLVHLENVHVSMNMDPQNQGEPKWRDLFQAHDTYVPLIRLHPTDDRSQQC